MPRLVCCFLLFISLPSFAQSYQEIHNKAIVIDTHNDVLSEVTMKGLNIENDLTGKSHSDIARFRRGGIDIQIFSIFCDERFGKDTAFKFANIEIDSLYSIVRRNPAKMMIVTNPKELQQAVKQKKLGCMIGVEGGHMIEDNLDYLDALYKRGARYMTLTWNNSTSWATSAADETAHPKLIIKERFEGQSRSSQDAAKTNDTSKSEVGALMASPTGGSRKGAGLSEFGKQVVQRMNQLGMIVDLSHVGEQTFWDAINTTTKPVIASHSNAWTLCPVFRNLKDDQIKAIGKNGGVIHLNFYSGFVDSNYNKNKAAFLHRHQPEVDSLKSLKWANYEIEEWTARKYPQEVEAYRPNLSQLLDHLDYIVKLIGVDHVGFGSDFDGIESAPRPLDDVTAYPSITKALLERGYSKKDIEKILGGNFIRVFKANQQN
ncbi:MAG: dipeptidase [Flavisolibacter sp.]